MSTSGTNVQAYILEEMAKYPLIFKADNEVLILIALCIGEGVYKALQELDDVSGTPPSTGHQ